MEFIMKKIAIFLVIVIVAAAGYGTFAYTNKKWPFTEAATTNSPTAPLVITKANVDKNILSVGLKKSISDNAYCVLEFRSKLSVLTIDDSKIKKDPKVKDCTGWNVSVEKLPKGAYTITVTMHASSKTYE